MKNIALLGSTGSIGRNTLNIVAANRDRFRIISMSAGSNMQLLVEQIKTFLPKAVCVGDKTNIVELKELFPEIKFYSGQSGLLEIVSMEDVDTLVSAITGTIPLEATIESIKLGHRICLANKETLVAAGTLINKVLEASVSDIIPIDSEQSAIFQSIGSNDVSGVHKIILTASGGPFYRKSRDEFGQITVKDALKHPTWNMGTKITIDSATLMNKALEIIEAYYLFNLKPEQIEAIIHPQSIVHSMVEFIDSSMIAQLSLPDMQVPILYSLSYPDRLRFKNNQLRLDELGKLEFFSVDRQKFPSVQMAYDIMDIGKNSGAVFNAANEVAVEYFLKDEISFTDIFRLVENVLNSFDFFEIDSIESVFNTIEQAKRKSTEIIKTL